MISIWPLYQTRSNGVATVTGELDNFNALNAINALYPTTTAGGVYHFYDTFNAMARTLVYQQSYDRLIGKYGWDAIWADNTEPQSYPEGVNVHAATTALGKGAFYINAYPLEHNRAVYEGWRKVGPNNKRVYILTRSAFAGQQRYAAGTWSGDINATQSVYVAQIPAGLSYAISGMPYWTTDIGGYFGTPSEELFTRWFQFGAFCPTFRIHGQAPKELYGSQWSAQGKANMLAVDQLRYRLMPYIYSLAWMVTSQGYTIMRPLVFDFQNDTMVYGIKDQFMFGPALLVNPVTATGATSRSVYLPAGTWYDFWTGSTTMGGTTSTANAPLSQIPIYVRGGSIVPMGPMIQYATQSADPLEIRVYAGADASFTIYEDEGDTYNYETGQYAQIPLTWNDAAKTLTIGARTGSYTGMPTTRTFNVVFVGANHGSGLAVSGTPDQVVTLQRRSGRRHREVAERGSRSAKADADVDAESRGEPRRGPNGDLVEGGGPPGQDRQAVRVGVQEHPAPETLDDADASSGLDDGHPRRGRMVDVLSGHPDLTGVDQKAGVPSRHDRARGGARQQMLLREPGAVRASRGRGYAHLGRELHRDVRPGEGAEHASEQDRRGRHAEPDRRSGADGEHGRGRRRVGARRLAAAPCAVRGVRPPVAAGRRRRRRPRRPRLSGAASQRAPRPSARQQLDLHREREAHRPCEVKAVGVDRAGSSDRRPTFPLDRATRCARPAPRPATRCARGRGPTRLR